MTDEQLKALIEAQILAKLKEATAPYFAELDSLIVNGDPNDDIASGRLWEHHFSDAEKPDSQN